MLNHPGYTIALDESGDFTNNKESLVMPYYTKVVIWKQSENRAKFSNVTKQIFHCGNAVQLNEACFVKANCTALRGPIRNEACFCKSFLLVLLRDSILVKQIERALPKKNSERGLATLHYFSLLLLVVYCGCLQYWIKRKRIVQKLTLLCTNFIDKQRW